jgi:hypothetical protein
MSPAMMYMLVQQEAQAQLGGGPMAGIDPATGLPLGMVSPNMGGLTTPPGPMGPNMGGLTIPPGPMGLQQHHGGGFAGGGMLPCQLMMMASPHTDAMVASDLRLDSRAMGELERHGLVAPGRPPFTQRGGGGLGGGPPSTPMMSVAHQPAAHGPMVATSTNPAAAAAVAARASATAAAAISAINAAATPFVLGAHPRQR